MAHKTPLPGTLQENLRWLKKALGNHRGAIFRDLAMPTPGGGTTQVLVVYFEAQASAQRVEFHLVRTLLERASRGAPLNLDVMLPATIELKTREEALEYLFRGKVLAQVEGDPSLYVVELSDMPHRDIPVPETETGITGPREAFTELLVMNLTQLRRRLPGTALHLESTWIGDQAPVEVVIAYAEGRTTERMLSEVRRRLGKIKVDGLQDSGQIAEALSDRALSLFPTVLITERPDTVIHYLMAGRVGVLMENAPRALIVPAVFLDFFVSVDDFYEWRPYVAFLRFLRFIAFNIAIPLPALYVSVTTYHLQALPTELTTSLLAQREGVPLPAPIEATVMTIIFEILREAGVRLPRSIGPTVSIVGGLVIGDAAIRSGITSPAMVLVVSATAVATFSLPSTTLANAATYYRYGVLALASAFGIFGLLIGYLAVLANLAHMTSLGVPYASPLFPFMGKHLATALGTKKRPPEGPGARPAPSLVQTAENYTEPKE